MNTALIFAAIGISFFVAFVEDTITRRGEP
jgi:hypothetical protein